jgi:hypothetical protein
MRAAHFPNSRGCHAAHRTHEPYRLVADAAPPATERGHPARATGQVGGGTVPHPLITIHHPCHVTGKPRIDILTDNA